MRRALAIVAVVAGQGCSKPASESRAPATGGEAGAPVAAADPARCAEHRQLLAGFAEGPPVGFAEEAILEAGLSDPVGYHTRPVPAEDAALARAAPVFAPGGAAELAATLAGPRAYVRLDRDRVGRADLDALRAAVPASIELRVLYARPVEERVERFITVFPRTPAAVREQLFLIDGYSTAADPLIAMAGSCGDALLALEPARRGAGADELGPGMAEALGKCDCALADLDGFVSLVGWLIAPMPEMGWLPIEDAR